MRSTLLMRRQYAKHLIAFLMRIVTSFVTSCIVWWLMTSSNRPVVRGQLQSFWCSKRTSLFDSAWITGDSTLCQTWMRTPCHEWTISSTDLVRQNISQPWILRRAIGRYLSLPPRVRRQPSQLHLAFTSFALCHSA